MSTHSLPGNIENVPLPAIPPNAHVDGCWNRVETAAARVLQAIGHCFVEMGSRFRDLVTVIRNITKIIPSNMVGTSIIKTIWATAKILHNVPGNNQWHERDELVDCIFKNYKYLEGHERARVMQAVEEIPASERFSVVFHTQKVIDPKGRYNVDETLQVLQGVRAIPTDKRSSVVIDAQEVIALKWCSIEDRLTVLKAVCDMPAENRRIIIKNASKLFLINMDVSRRISMIQSMMEIPIHEMEDATNQALGIIPPRATPEEAISIVQNMANIHALQRATVLEDLEGMVFVNRNPVEIIAFLEAVHAIPEDERTEVVRLVGDIMPITDAERQALLQAVRAIPGANEEREQIITNTRKLITTNMNVAERIDMMQFMREIFPRNEIENVTNNALRIIPLNANRAERISIVLHMANMTSDQRTAVCNALGFQGGGRNPGQISLFLMLARHALAMNPGNGAQDGLAAAQGTYVHDNDRDQRTKAAIEKLRNAQPGISEGDINTAVEAFKTYLDNGLDSEGKAKRALLGEKGNEAFGPLIGGPKFTILGLEISGKELIGRLWIFASTLAESDQVNAKQSMISALRDSYNGDGTRVCNPGKTQRLLIGVLQGRLEGVDIDGIKNGQLTTAAALNLFFSKEANRQIADWGGVDGLKAAAEAFLGAHNLVNRDKFMAGIRTYAGLRGMPIIENQEIVNNQPN